MYPIIILSIVNNNNRFSKELQSEYIFNILDRLRLLFFGLYSVSYFNITESTLFLIKNNITNDIPAGKIDNAKESKKLIIY